MSDMTKLLILTLAAAALGVPAGVPQAPSRPEENLRFPVDNDYETRLKMKREVMDTDMASKSETLTFPTSGTRRQSHARGIEKRDLFDQVDREGKYLESLELQPTPSRKFETRS